MNNEIFLKQMQNIYEPLKYFKIENNNLILNYEGTYTIPFNNVYLQNLNPNLFLINPKEIFHILYMLELLSNNNLNEYDIEFIKQYVNLYLKLNDEAIENQNTNNNVDFYRIPIYLSYDPEFINSPTSNIIQTIINNHSNEIENSKGKHPRLVLKNPNFETINEENYITDFGKAGFTTLIIIVSTVIITSIYIAYFMGK